MHRCIRRISRLCIQDEFPVPKRIAGNLIWTQRRLLTSEPPEPHIVQWILKCLSPGDVFFDVGAHYGWMSMAGASRVGGSGRVMAFEASPVLVDILSYHKRMNRLSQIEIVPKAVSAVGGTIVPFFLLNGGLSSRNSLTIGADDVPYVKPDEKTRCNVTSISLDQFSLESGAVPNLIKIDVEGAELLVLQGAERLLMRSRPALIVSLHPYWLPEPESAAQFFDFLHDHNYRIRDQFAIDFDQNYIADYLCTASSVPI